MPSKVKPVKTVAAPRSYDVELRLVFHDFGNHGQAHFAGHGDYAFAHGGIFVVGDHVFHERLVDLDAAGGQVFQVAEAGKAGAKIINRRGNAQLLQGIHQADGAAAVFHQHAFGQIQLQQISRQAGFGQNVLQRVQKPRAVELQRRQIHPHVPRQQPHFLQLNGILTGLGENPLAQRHNLAGFLCQRQKTLRRNQPAGRVLPAHQRLALYIAMSAWRISFSGDVSLSSSRLIPILADKYSSWPSTCWGRAIFCRMRSATSSACRADSRSGSSTTNSSPPNRARVKSCCNFSSNSVRLARPVSASCEAWYASFFSNNARPDERNSQADITMPPTTNVSDPAQEKRNGSGTGSCGKADASKPAKPASKVQASSKNGQACNRSA